MPVITNHLKKLLKHWKNETHTRTKRIKIAEVRGIQKINQEDWWGWNFNGIEMPGDMPSMVKVPDYFSDLNAMHEAVGCLTDEQVKKFDGHLWKIVGDNCIKTGRLLDGMFWYASAEQYAEAFG